MLTDYDLNVAFAERMLRRKPAWQKGEMPGLRAPRYIDPARDRCASAEIGHPEDCDFERPLKAKGASKPEKSKPIKEAAAPRRAASAASEKRIRRTYAQGEPRQGAHRRAALQAPPPQGLE